MFENKHPHAPIYCRMCRIRHIVCVCIHVVNTDVACVRHVSEQQNENIDLLMCAAVPCHRLGSGKGSVIILATIRSFVQTKKKNP